MALGLWRGAWEREKLAARLARGQLTKLALLPRDQQHFAGVTHQRAVAPPIVRRFDDQARGRAKLGEPRRCVETNSVLARASPIGAARPRLHGEYSRERVEGSLLGVQSSIGGFPPVALEKSRHDAVATGAVPHQRGAGLEDARELRDHVLIVGRIGEEAERGEEIQDGVEAVSPFGRQTAHVAAMVLERRSGASGACLREERRREIQAIDAEPRLGEKMAVPPLATWDVENACFGGQAQQIDEPRDFLAVAFEREQWLVLAQVLLVEVSRPPLPVPIAQKKTGSR